MSEAARPLSAPAAEAQPAGRDVAVIDIGSNSVRMVQFRVEGRALWPVFNEKTMAGLGRGAARTGRLNPEGVETALRALRRFGYLMADRAVSERYAVATAAVRAAEDGPAFTKTAQAALAAPVQILSGEEEGRLSALGVLAGLGEVHGVAGDLGGSSLELTALNGRAVGPATSLPLGPLSVLDEGARMGPGLSKRLDKTLAEAGSVFESAGKTFIAVGGAWRAFARLTMARDHPLGVLHQYALPRREAIKLADVVVKQSEASIAATPGVSGKRAATTPYAALLLRRILEAGGFEAVVFSAYGLREGVVFAGLPADIAAEDPLLAGARALARAAAMDLGFGEAAGPWLEPILSAEAPVFDADRDYRLRQAAGLLADIGARLHPDHRADLVSDQILYAPFGGINHAERAFLARTLFHRYGGKRGGADWPAGRLLTEAQREGALKLGLGLRLAAALSGRSDRLLNAFRLSRGDGTLTLSGEPALADLAVERALRRFEQFASAMGLTAAAA